MVRKSVLVYDLLKSEKPEDGFTENEIMNRLQVKHGLNPGKGIRRQISVALRRGIDYGILVKKAKKYRFDPDSVKNTPRKRPPKTTKRKATKKNRLKNKTSTDNRKPPPEVPRPTVPPLPDWTPKRRNLREEPVSKVIKHPEAS